MQLKQLSAHLGLPCPDHRHHYLLKWGHIRRLGSFWYALGDFGCWFHPFLVTANKLCARWPHVTCCFFFSRISYKWTNLRILFNSKWLVFQIPLPLHNPWCKLPFSYPHSRQEMKQESINLSHLCSHWHLKAVFDVTFPVHCTLLDGQTADVGKSETTAPVYPCLVLPRFWSFSDPLRFFFLRKLIRWLLAVQWLRHWTSSAAGMSIPVRKLRSHIPSSATKN